MIEELKSATIRTGILLARGFALGLASAPAWAAGGGRLVATQAISGLSTEVSGPLAYGLSLIMIVVAAVNFYRSHHDMSHLGSGIMGTLFVAGVACGAASLLGFVPGVAGAVI
jgi:type IV secretory pathway VirB2 component (pilin)